MNFGLKPHLTVKPTNEHWLDLQRVAAFGADIMQLHQTNPDHTKETTTRQEYLS